MTMILDASRSPRRAVRVCRWTFVRSLWFVLVLGMVLPNAPAAADDCKPRDGVIHVPDDCPTIQTAIDAASDGDEILVAAGVYNEAIVIDGKSLILRSLDGPTATIIDATGLNSSAVHVQSLGTPETFEFRGFTVQGGYGNVGGGGILFWDSNYTTLSPEILVTNCIFQYNTAIGGGGGGGINLLMTSTQSGSFTVSDTTFKNNVAIGQVSRGGALRASSPNLTYEITNCIFENNSSYQGGACFLAYSEGFAFMINNCVFSGNTALQFGGAVRLVGSSGEGASPVTIQNSSFYGNHVAGCDGCVSNVPYGGGAIYSSGVPTMVSNCNFSGNSVANSPHDNFGRGGAILLNHNLSATGELTVLDSHFESNANDHFSGRGGAIYASALNVTNSDFYNNMATREGGAIVASNFASNTPSNVLMNCHFEGNQVGWAGGGITMSSGTISHCTLYNNVSTCYSGGVRALSIGPNPGNVSVINSTILSNSPRDICGEWDDAGGNTVGSDAGKRCCSQANDPNQPKDSPLVVDGSIVYDVDLLDAHGEPVDGLVADGVTRLILRVPVRGPGTVEFTVDDGAGDDADVGSLGTPGTDEAETIFNAPVHQLADGRFVAFAELRAPADFVRTGYPEDADAAVRTIRIIPSHMPNDPEDATPFVNPIYLSLHRPPVVLLHGLHDQSASWGWALKSDERFQIKGVSMVEAQDYEASNALSFLENIGQPYAGIDTVLKRMRSHKVAATQADVFGHSMGGLLARMYALDEVAGVKTNFKRNDNFSQGDINRLITVNTPHRGSPIAWQMIGPDALPTEFGQLTIIQGHLMGDLKDITSGAVRDLRPDSAAMNWINSKMVPMPVHAMYGVSGVSITKYYQRTLAGFYIGCNRRSPSSAFEDEHGHDCVVGVTSQRGGLSGDHVSEISGNSGQHWPIISQTDIGGWPSIPLFGTPPGNVRAIQLLNSRLDSGVYADGFPKFTGPPNVPSYICEPGNVLDAVLVLWSLTLPLAGGEPVQPGDIVEVGVEGDRGYVPDTIFITTSDGEFIELNKSMPTAMIQIPETWLGAFSIVAYSLDEHDQLAQSNEVVLQVQTDADLLSLSVMPESVSLHTYLPQALVKVTGSFSDNIDRDLSSASSGTVYSSSDENIATVDAAGMVKAKTVGSAVITVMNGKHFVELPVTVHTAKADWNADGNVDMADSKAFAACFSGPSSEEGYAHPGYPCQNVFDFDNDGDVDCDDWTVFQTYWTGPPEQPPFFAPCDCAPADLNCDGVVNVLDLLILLEAWGACPDCGDCAADLNDDCTVDVLDLLILLENWG